MPRKTLVAGFGNTLLGDDGFGVAVVSRLAARALPPEVDVFDVGIGGMHFVLRLLEGFEQVVVVDAVRGGQPPGTLYIFTFETVESGVQDGAHLDPHVAEPARALHLARALGLLPARVIVVGCEPQSCQPGLCLTPAVHTAVNCAVERIQRMVFNDGESG